MMDAKAAFKRYEAIRPRLPDAAYPGAVEAISDLPEIAEQADAFVFDAFGVLNVGETPIPGARACIDALRRAGKRVFVLTNAASANRSETEKKFNDLGFDFADSEIVSSRDAALAALAAAAVDGAWGVMAPPDYRADDFPCPTFPLEDADDAYDRAAGFLLLSAKLWTDDRQARLVASQRRRPRPVIVANPDLVAPRETGLSYEPGFYGHALWDATGHAPAFHGKPFPSVYSLVETQLNDVRPERIVMVGDTLHTDVLGARARGWRTALATDNGLFAGLDAQAFIDASGIRPDWRLPAI